MSAWIPPLLLQSTADEGLTLQEMVQSLPTDPASLFALVLVGGFLGSILYFGRQSGKDVDQ